MNLIKKYLQSALTEEEQISFEKRMQEDPELVKEVQKAVFKSRFDDVDHKEHWPGITRTKASSKKRRATLVAGIALLGICGYYYLNLRLSEDKVINRHLAEPYIAPVLSMQQTEVSEYQWREAIRAYQERNYENASLTIESMIPTGKVQPEHYFYLGLSYLYADPPDYDKAINNLMRAKVLNETHFGLQSNWYLALAHLKQNNKIAARPLLIKIVEEADWKKAEANELLLRMERSY